MCKKLRKLICYIANENQIITMEIKTHTILEYSITIIVVTVIEMVMKNMIVKKHKRFKLKI